ncbi:MAG: hypothetical protein HY652_10680 [Acidobacteria bacterium]|nr:hypothetical protein [Acidobacteriota bacterium]
MRATHKHFSTVLVVVAALVTAVAAAADNYLQPRVPTYANKKLTKQDLLPNVRNYLQGKMGDGGNAPNLKGGEKVLIVTDRTVDPLVVEALETGILEVPRVDLTVIKLRGFPELTDASDILEEVFLKVWWPDYVFQAMETADLVIPIARFTDAHLLPDDWYGHRKKHDARWVRFPWVTPELLYSGELSFPRELFDLINKKVWAQMVNARQLKVTDPLGTDVTVEIDPRFWEDMKKLPGGLDVPRTPGHITMRPAAYNTRANGVEVANQLHTGPVPKIKLTIQDSKAVSIEGGGKFGETLKAVNEKYKDIHYPGFREPGIAWLEEISLGTHPKAIRALNVEKLTGGAKWWGGAQGRRRSGVLHLAYGTSIGANGNLEFQKRSGHPVQHRDTELYHATYILDGKTIVKDGHLMVLDDPEVRALAAKYGNPDQLLREDWIPPVGN